jgi:FkbM family methyltransferase
MALSVFPGTRVILIEPQQEMQPFLKRLSEESQGLKMEVIQAGAGKEAGQLVQTIWEDLDGSSFLPEPDEEKLRKGTQRVTPIVTIDNLLTDRTDFNPDLVKLDIQGFEIEALKGATSLFGRTEVFIIETSLYEFMPKMPITADVINFMADNGYNLYDVTEFLRRPIDGALGQIDLAFVLKGGRFRKSNRWNAE